MKQEDRELIARYLDGAKAAAECIEGWVRQAAYPYRRRLASEWEDAVQTVLLEVTRLLRDERFRGDSSLKTYVWRVANNACIDQLRSGYKYQWSDLEVVDLLGEIPRAAARETTERSEDRDLALRVLAEMTEDCRELWRMLYQGLSYRQMSRRTGVSEGALRVRVLRCRRRALEVRDQLQTNGGAQAG